MQAYAFYRKDNPDVAIDVDRCRPIRKQPFLSVAVGGQSKVVAYFRSDADADLFYDFLSFIAEGTDKVPTIPTGIPEEVECQ